MVLFKLFIVPTYTLVTAYMSGCFFGYRIVTVFNLHRPLALEQRYLHTVMRVLGGVRVRCTWGASHAGILIDSSYSVTMVSGIAHMIWGSDNLSFVILGRGLTKNLFTRKNKEVNSNYQAMSKYTQLVTIILLPLLESSRILSRIRERLQQHLQ